MKITFLEPYATDDGSLFSAESKDVYTFYRTPARGIDLLATLCREAGYLDTRSITLKYYWGERGLTEKLWTRLAESDVVGISAISRTAPPAYALAREVRAINPKAWIVFGGPHTTALPDEALEYGDVVVMREGDRTILELLERINENRETPCLEGLKGIAFRDGEETFIAPPRPFLIPEEFNALPFPEYPPEVLKGISTRVMITSRGCPHGCSYCAVIENFGRCYRSMTPERMFEYFEHLTANSDKQIFIGDDNFTANPGRIKKWCELILASGRKKQGWSAQVRVEAAKDKELLKLMKRAGCHTVMIGLESIDDETLRLWNKRSSLDKNIEAIKGFQDARIDVHGMFVLGSEQETADTVRKTVDFAKKLKITTAQFFSITPLPGTPLTREYEKKGCILNKEWQLYDGQHVLVEPDRMNAAELQKAILDAHKDFYSLKEAFRHLFYPGYQHRFYSAMIRFAGRGLTRRICRAIKPHLKGLEKLEQWKQSFHDQFYGLQSRLASFTESLSGDLSEQKDKLQEMLDQVMDRLRDSLNTLSEEYHPYCRRLLENLRVSFMKEAEAVLA
ncbi:MAG: radical SAM protein [Planctomycetota bacterium]